MCHLILRWQILDHRFDLVTNRRIKRLVLEHLFELLMHHCLRGVRTANACRTARLRGDGRYRGSIAFQLWLQVFAIDRISFRVLLLKIVGIYCGDAYFLYRTVFSRGNDANLDAVFAALCQQNLTTRLLNGNVNRVPILVDFSVNRHACTAR